MKWLGWLALLLCCVMLFIWIPLDVETGIIEKVRRQVTLGDAFAPTIAAVIIGLGGLIILLERPQAKSETSNQTATPSERSLRPPSMADVRHATVIFVLVTISLLLMRYAGPLIVQLFEGSDAQYRLLRDTAPWKYIGFIAGGLWLIISLIVLIERRLTWQHILIAGAAVLVLIAFYDLPFEDLLLPPNGDV